MKNKLRPTSPHLQIYAWNISSFTSILHRLTGVALYFSIVAISWYIVFFTYRINDAPAEENCDCWTMLDFISAFAAIAIIFCLYYHFLNGIRNLFWDVGKGFELKTAKRNGYLILFLTLLLSLATIGLITYYKYL